MNYRHAFHAANFADVVKHVLLARILVHLAEKPTPFRVIDTHAGIGLYDLSSPEAVRTGEWRDGFGRLLEPLDGEAEALLAPYRQAIAALRATAGDNAYPGSPLIAAHALRAQDSAVFVEKHPTDIERLRRALSTALGRDQRVKALPLDGWVALNAMIPPPERRGLVLIDPPYEAPDEFARLADALIAASRKWPTGIYAAWYPIKAGGGADALARRLAEAGVPKVLRLDVVVDPAGTAGPLAGTGLIVINPPWRLAQEASIVLPALAERLARGPRVSWRADWITGE